MPHVRKADILAVVRELWGSTGVIEDEAKLVLAEHLIADMWDGKKSGVALSLAGQPVKQALGDRWLASKERTAAGMPTFSDVLAQDPYFSVKAAEGTQPCVKLRISRLSQLITNPDLIKEYRSPASSTLAVAGAGQSTSSAATAPVRLTNEGLPIRPGQPVCQHYVKHGWCVFKQDCWFSHPPERAGKRKAVNSTDTDSLVESYLEPGVMLRNGVYPVRPNRPTCGFYLKNGWCIYKAKCKNDHPALKGSDAAGAAIGASVSSPVQDMPSNSLVKQPPTQLILGVVIDSVWPPRASKECYVKGQLAKHILETQLKPHDCMEPSKCYEVSMAAAGIYLSQWWPTQNLYDPMTKPYKSLADVVKEDPYYRLGRNNQQLILLFGEMLPAGGSAAAEKLSQMADAVWPPAAGRETWLRGKLAKWLFTAGFSGEGGAVLRKVLTVSPDAATVFRIDMEQAGEYLRRCWEMQEHPYDSSSAPWTQFKPLIAADRFLYIESAPGRSKGLHISIDLADMLQSLPSFGRAARASGSSQASAASATTRADGAGTSSSDGGAGASSNTAAADDMMNLQDEEDEVMQGMFSEAWPALSAAAGPSRGSAASSMPGGSAAAQQRQLSRPGSMTGSRAPSGRASSAGDPVAEAEADLATLQALIHEPPANMQWWWPEGRPEQPGWAWTEVAIRLVDSSGDQAMLQLAEMAQHLEICPILSVGCSVYKQHPHLLQFFAPHVSVGGLEMPSTVYLIDILRAGQGVKQVLDLIRPVLSSSQNVKVTHGSKLWSGQLDKSFGIHLSNYIDTQQANFVWNCLRHAAGKAPNMTGGTLKSTESASMSALMRNHGFHHPVRHTAEGKEQPRLWQERPLSEELITCAAADVVYLLPLMEVQAHAIKALAAEVRQQNQQRPGSRANELLLNLPPSLAPKVLELLAAGAETGAGTISTQKIADWARLDAFHQVPLH